MALQGPGGLIETEYVNPQAGERHSLRLHVAHFDPTPVTTDYGADDRLYVPGGPVAPTEASVLATFAAAGALWSPYYSAQWTLYLRALRQMLPDASLQQLLPLPAAASVVGTNSQDDGTGPRLTRRIRLLGRNGAVRHLWLSQVQGDVEPAGSLEVSTSTGGMDARDQAWVAYLSGQSGGAAVCPDGTYCFPVTDMRLEWARPLEAPVAPVPGAPYVVSG